MEDLYALYLKLYALHGAGDSEHFSATLEDETGRFDDVVKLIELNAAAAIAVSDILLDYYDFQQRWDRFRSIAPRQ
jgi:hypothetical protein